MSGVLARGRPFPRKALIFGWTVVLSAIALAAYGSLTGMAKNSDASQVIATRSLVFADRADGAVVIKSADDGSVVDVAEGQQGFLRGTLRGFARVRRANGVGPAAPMVLTAYADGRLLLTDPATSRHVDLEAFGVDNELVFSRLLKLEPLRQGNGE